jgi:hypothetical protein
LWSWIPQTLKHLEICPCTDSDAIEQVFHKEPSLAQLVFQRSEIYLLKLHTLNPHATFHKHEFGMLQKVICKARTRTLLWFHKKHHNIIMQQSSLYSCPCAHQCKWWCFCIQMLKSSELTQSSNTWQHAMRHDQSPYG